MTVIPAVNETMFSAVKSRLVQALEILKNALPSEALAKEGWVHIDVADGTFTSNVLWHDPKEFGELKKLCQKAKVKVEVHLMVKEPERRLGDWLRAGADRVIIHYEEMELKDNTMLFGDAVVVGAGPETQIKECFECIAFAPRVLLLAVTPGRAGQKFDERTLEKIKLLKGRLPNVTIEIDGGVNLETARALKSAGADVLVSASYLWQSPDPQTAFQNLRNI